MSELERLELLNAMLQLVPKGETVEQLERNASDFTNEAAKALYAEGWCRIRKTDGKNVDGLDIDKLVRESDGELRDIVVNAGLKTAFVAWQHVGYLRDRSRYVEVRPDAQEPPLPPPPTPDRDDALIELADAIDANSDAIRAIERTLQSLAGVLTELRDTVERIATRLS